MQRKASIKAVHLITKKETCRFKAYRDGGDIWTCGWGHTAGVSEDTECTQEEADQWLLEDLADAENKIDRAVKVELNQDQFDALVSFVYNVGHIGHDMLRLIDNHDFEGAAQQFKLFVHDANGNVEPGLVERRAEEEAMFRGAV